MVLLWAARMFTSTARGGHPASRISHCCCSVSWIIDHLPEIVPSIVSAGDQLPDRFKPFLTDESEGRGVGVRGPAIRAKRFRTIRLDSSA